MSREAVEVLGAGEVLLSGPAVSWFATLAERAVHTQRLNGTRNPVAEQWVAAMADAVTRMRTADVGRSAVPTGHDLAASGPVDPVSASQAAVILNRKVRNVTDLCARGAFGTARRVGGRWQIERAEVLDRAGRVAS